MEPMDVTQNSDEEQSPIIVGHSFHQDEGQWRPRCMAGVAAMAAFVGLIVFVWQPWQQQAVPSPPPLNVLALSHGLIAQKYEAATDWAFCDASEEVDSDRLKGTEAATKSPGVWTFSYGSNMGHWKLKDLGISPTFSTPAVLHDHELSFDLCWAECYANIPPSPGHCVHGLALQITEDDFQKLTWSEGSYTKEELEVVTYDGKRLKAWTYKYQLKDWWSGVGMPSHRYAKLVYCGLMENKFSTAYMTWFLNYLKALGSPTTFTCQQGVHSLYA